MATRRLALVIEAGDKTCASEPGKFCPQLRVKRFGSQFVCALFEHTELQDDQGVLSGSGWLQRLPQCLSAEVGR